MYKINIDQNELHFAFNKPIDIICCLENNPTEKEIIQMKIPTVEMMFFDREFIYFMEFASGKIKELEEIFAKMNIKNMYDTIVWCHMVSKDKFFKELLDIFINVFKKLNINLQINSGLIYITDKISINETQLDEIINIIKKSCGIKTINTKNLTPEEIAIEERIQKIKNTNKKSQNGGLELHNILPIICHYFNTKTNEILNNNFYNLEQMIRVIHKLNAQAVSNIAYGFGNSKKLYNILGEKDDKQ